MSIVDNPPPVPTPAFLPPDDNPFKVKEAVVIKDAMRIRLTGRDAANGSPEFFLDFGEVTSKAGFRATSGANGTVTAADYGIDPVFLPYLNGKALLSLRYWKNNDTQPGILAKFQRSKETYQINFGDYEPYVVVSPAGKSSVKPSISISATQSSATEGGEFPSCIFAANVVQQKDLVVEYTLSGNASNGSDYKRLNGKVKIRAGLSSAVVILRIKDDAKKEATETVNIRLKPLPNSYTRDPNARRASIEILDNE